MKDKQTTLSKEDREFNKRLEEFKNNHNTIICDVVTADKIKELEK